MMDMSAILWNDAPIASLLCGALLIAFAVWRLRTGPVWPTIGTCLFVGTVGVAMVIAGAVMKTVAALSAMS